MIVRISTGHFEASQYDAVHRTLTEGGARLVPAIREMAGCLHYYAGIDRESGRIINVSVWDTLEHAQRMAALQAMQAEGALMRSLGVRFEPIVNHETVWKITP